MKKVVIVEDNVDYSNLLARVVTKGGYEVTVFNDDANLTSRIKNIAPDLILLDIMLPHTSGLSILEELKKDNATKAIPVFCLTNLPEEIGRDKALSLGAHAYFTKVHYNVYDVVKHVDAFFKETENVI